MKESTGEGGCTVCIAVSGNRIIAHLHTVALSSSLTAVSSYAGHCSVFKEPESHCLSLGDCYIKTILSHSSFSRQVSPGLCACDFWRLQPLTENEARGFACFFFLSLSVSLSSN